MTTRRPAPDLSTHEARVACIAAALRENVGRPGALLEAAELVARACGRKCFVEPERPGHLPFPTLAEVFAASPPAAARNP